jgi:triphosphoribosyl-dephospho-CoA synthetase
MLLIIMKNTIDTNVAGRANLEIMSLLQRQAGIVLRDPAFVIAGDFRPIAALNALYVQENISPGGYTNLLGAVIFLWKL